MSMSRMSARGAFLIAVVLVVCNDEHLMGKHRNGAWMNLLGTTTVLVMAAAAAALLF